jgi:CRP-like cAMP-binding protein
MPPTLSISNRLLRSLAADDLDPLRPHLHAVTLSHRQALSKPGTPIEDVYFVQDGMVSLVQPLENGAMIEVGMIGNEGFAMMLGVRRSGVTVAVGTLKSAGLINNSHGRVTIIDRQGLRSGLLRVLPHGQD